MVEIIKRYYKLIVVMIFLVTAIFYGQYVYSSGVVKQLGEEKVNDSFALLNEQINYWLAEKEKVIEDSNILISYTDNEEEIKTFLIEKLGNNSEFSSLYYLSKENKMINASGYVPPPDIDFRSRPWYEKATEEKKLVFTQPFLNATKNDLIVSIAEPVFDSSGEMKGVVAGDISLRDISSILMNTTHIPGAKSFLLDENDYLIVDSSQRLFDKGSFEEYTNYSFDEFVFFRNQEGRFLSEELENNSWKILMFTPSGFISQPVATLRGNFIITLVIFFVTMFMFAYFQKKVISEPLVTFELDSKKKIERERKNFEALFKNSSDAIAIVDNYNQVIDINEKFENLFKYKKEEVRGKNIDTLIVTEKKIDEAKKFTDLLFKEKVESVETVRYDKFKSPKDVELKGTPILFEGEIIGGYASYTDISGRKAFEKKILFMSYHDQLTGIYNRRYFEEEIKKIDIAENYPLYLVMADLNGLKLANDAFGHPFGDELLIKTAEIIASSLKETEFVARTGGDEFIIVLPKKDNEEFRDFISNLTKKIQETRIGNIDLSVSFGWEVKTDIEQNIIDLLNKAESYMYKRKLSESPSMVSSTIKLIISTLHEKNNREKQHSERVGDICYAIGQEMSFAQDELSELKLIGLMHDIGKIGIDENILNKKGRLTEEEYEEIKKHPEIGYRILSSANQMSEIAEYTLAHHERWDGKGYPNGIMGKEIPLISRIIAVADAFDAMTSERTYRKPLTEKEAVEELRKNAGTQFDPVVVKIFTEKVLKY